MHYFDDDDTRPLLVDDESESENMTSYVIVVNNCKRGHDAIDITLKKHTTQTSLSQELDEQLGYLSNYILELEVSTLQVDLESFEPEEINGELFFKACAVQSRTKKSIDDLDILEGYENRTATDGRVRGPEYRHIKKNIYIKIMERVRSGSIPDCSKWRHRWRSWSKCSWWGVKDTSEVEHHQENVDTEGKSAVADEAVAEDASTRGIPVE